MLTPHAHQMTQHLIEPLPELSTADVDKLIYCITEWEHAFKTRQDWTMDQTIALTECPKHLESALVDTVNAHRFYLTRKKKCQCIACNGQRIKIMLASLPPLHHDQEIGDNNQ